MNSRARVGVTVLLALLARPVFADSDTLVVEMEFDSPPDTRIKLNDALSIGADVEVETIWERNFDLDRQADDDFLTLEPNFGLALSWTPTQHLRGFTDLELARQYELDVPAGSQRPTTRLRIRQAHATLTGLPGDSALQIGRQPFDDAREWLYDEKLDAVRLFTRFGRFAIEASVSREALFADDLLNRDRTERINNYILLGRYAHEEHWELNAYVIHRDDHDTRPEDLTFFGVRSIGEITSRIEHWVELGAVRGTFRDTDIRGYGLDIGGTYQWRSRLRPAVTAGFAFGTGDNNRRDSVDRNFRQTGLQDNNGKFGGVTSFKYYGELVEPELSNMFVFTLGVGIRPTRRSSIDLVYHHYRQHRAEDDIRDSNLEMDPDGDHRALGHALDLIVGFRELEDLSVELILGAFRPGRAFANGDTAYYGALELKYAF